MIHTPPGAWPELGPEYLDGKKSVSTIRRGNERGGECRHKREVRACSLQTPGASAPSWL